MRNEIGLMEDNLENIIGQQLHLEIEGQGVYDYDAVKLFEVNGTAYLLCCRLSEGREGYLLTFDDLGDGWYTMRDITDDAEWELAREASGWQEHTANVER